MLTLGEMVQSLQQKHDRDAASARARLAAGERPAAPATTDVPAPTPDEVDAAVQVALGVALRALFAAAFDGTEPEAAADPARALELADAPARQVAKAIARAVRAMGPAAARGVVRAFPAAARS